VAKESDELEQLASDLRVASFLLTRRMRLESHLEAVTDSQLTVLMHLSRVGARTPGQLAEYERVSAPSMNRTLNALEGAGYVRRVDDPADRRRVIVELMPDGDELARTARTRRNAWLKRELAPMSGEERELLSRAAAVIAGMARR